jgi:alpha-ketoglutarate-dependent taurine dioxygenase
MKQRLLFDGSSGPLLIEPSDGQRDLADVTSGAARRLAADLLEHGAILFRGFRVEAVQHFDAFVWALGMHRLDYMYRSTPRTAVGDRIFTATEYPASQEIPLHNENAYQRRWPLEIALCCLVPATAGGETPISSMRAVTRQIGLPLIEKFATEGVRYVRHYHPYADLPWQRVFQTEDRATMARYCQEQDIELEWLPGDVLRTAQRCQGTTRHPATGEEIFFNQAHLFHVSSLGEEASASMASVFGSDRLPRQAFYGSGQDIPRDTLTQVRTGFAANAVSFKWRAGDVLLLDNLQYAHGRRAYQGARKVLAALLDSSSTDS